MALKSQSQSSYGSLALLLSIAESWMVISGTRRELRFYNHCCSPVQAMSSSLALDSIINLPVGQRPSLNTSHTPPSSTCLPSVQVHDRFLKLALPLNHIRSDFVRATCDRLLVCLSSTINSWPTKLLMELRLTNRDNSETTISRIHATAKVPDRTRILHNRL